MVASVGDCVVKINPDVHTCDNKGLVDFGKTRDCVNVPPLRFYLVIVISVVGWERPYAIDLMGEYHGDFYYYRLLHIRCNEGDGG